jgi:ribosome maturation factor RimP
VALQQIVQETVTGLGYDLVEIDRTAGGLLRITIDWPWQLGSELFINVEDCEKVNRQLQFALEVDGVTYNRLEVSSPGIDRPLTRLKDFDVWADYEARVETSELIDGRRRFKGMLRGTEGDEILIEIEEAGAPLTIGLKFDWLSDAKLILTEELIAEMLRQRKASGIVDETEFDEIDDSESADEAEDGLDAPVTKH